MSNNFLITQGSGTTVATEQGIGLEHYQKIKLIDPTPGATGGIGITGTPLKIDGSGVTQPVSGTFWQTTQPVSGTFWQATQPVSGTFFQATQPVSIAAAVTTAEDYSTGKTGAMKTGTLVTTAVTADQVILSYTVTSGKTFYLLYYAYDTRLTVVSAVAAVLGTISLEIPSGNKVITSTEVNPTTSETGMVVVSLPVPIPISSGTVIRVVCTPASTTSTTWIGNFGGYEK